MNAKSIYIHIPFCKTKCPYCDFASWANKENLIERYFDALLEEIKTKCEAYEATRHSRENGNDVIEGSLSTIKTIFIGGGTPSLIPPELYEKLFDELKKYFNILPDCEITLEVNPGTAKDEYLKGYKKLGINRISIGAQSFNEKILETLGRKHSVEETIEAINKIKAIGLTNFNLDFIFSVPGMTKEIWTESIYRALEYDPKHVSAYSLIIEPNTPFENIYKDPKLLPDDNLASEFYFELCNILKIAGFNHYEISNFAKPGFESMHNLTYWNAKEYFAFGTGAHRYLNGLRTANLRDLDAYISFPNREIILDFPTNHDFEKIMLNSRISTGFDIHLINKTTTKSQYELRNILKELQNNGYIELSNDKIHLTEKGFFVNNEILLKLI